MKTAPAIALFLCMAVIARTGGGATDDRDGSSFDRAILVPGDYKHYVDWEWTYLSKKFRGRGIPKEHTLTQHKGRTYDRFVFGTAGRDKTVYFDVTRFEKDIFKKRTKSLEQLMKEMGIPIEKRK